MWMGNTGGCTAACSASFRRALGLRRPVHGEAGAGVVQRAEERDAQDVVEVEVGEQRRGVHRRPERPHLPVQDVAQRAQPGAEVDDERLVPLDVDDEARGVPPVAPVAIPRARARPPHAVERDVHPLDDTLRRRGTFCPPWSNGPSPRTGWSSPASTDGPDDGPLALCLHGFPDTAHTWRYLLPELAAAGFRAVAPFLRGYAPTADPGRRALPDGRPGAGRQRAARGRSGAATTPSSSATTGAPWPPTARWPTNPIAGAAPSRRPSPRRRPSACRCSPTPSCSGAGTCSSSCPRWRRWRCPLDDYSFIDHLWRDWSPGYDGDVGRRPGEGVHRRPRAHRRRHQLLPRHVRPVAAGARAGRRAGGGARCRRRSRRCTCTAATTTACCCPPSAPRSTSWPRAPRWRSSTAPATSSTWSGPRSSTAASSAS